MVVMVGQRKKTCAKCGKTSIEDPTITFHRFPLPSIHGSLKATVWAKYCFPNDDWSSEQSLSKLYTLEKYLCGIHFDDSSFTSSERTRLNKFAIPYEAQNILTQVRDELNNHQLDPFVQASTSQSSSTEFSNEHSPPRPKLTKLPLLTMCDEGFVNAKSGILELFSSLTDIELDSIEQWICSQSYRKDLEQKRALQSTEKTLIKIGNTVKKIVPLEAEMHSENIIPPTVGDQADCNKINTYHIDEFLYDEAEVEKLVEKSKIRRYYCLDCNSRNIKPLTYISHSMSRQALQYIFNVLLPQDLEGKLVLDIGSRIGAVLYGAYYYSNASTIIGIEMNKEWCEIQERIINQYTMDSNRIKVVHSDVMETSDIVASADVIVINVLDFFVDIEKHKKMWYFFKKHIKKGSYLVCNRSMAETLSSLDLLEELMEWLTISKPQQLENEIFFDIEIGSEIFLYIVN